MQEVCAAVQEDMGGADAGFEISMVPPPGMETLILDEDEVVAGASTLNLPAVDVGFGPSLQELGGGVLLFNTNFGAQHLFPQAERGTPALFGLLSEQVASLVAGFSSPVKGYSSEVSTYRYCVGNIKV